MSVIDVSSDSGQVCTAGCEDEINNNDRETVTREDRR